MKINKKINECFIITSGSNFAETVWNGKSMQYIKYELIEKGETINSLKKIVWPKNMELYSLLITLHGMD